MLVVFIEAEKDDFQGTDVDRGNEFSVLQKSLNTTDNPVKYHKNATK